MDARADRWLPDAAVAYTRRNLAVFQLWEIVNGRCGCGNPTCDAVGKHPVPPGWQNTVPSITAVERAWMVRPDRGIGLACGPRSGVFGLDIDPRHGGEIAFKALIDRHGPLPETWTDRTGSGGWHLMFAWAEGINIRNSTGKLGPGIDVRGVGGYVVLAPSPHVSGNPYRSLRPPDTLASAPPWLLDLITAPPRPGRNGSGPAEVVKVPAGRRHAALVSLLGLMHDWGACEQVLDAAGVAFVTHQCLEDPARPISLEHVHATARDIARRY